MSANGSAAGRPATASWNALSIVVERVGEHDRAAVHLGIEAGLGGELREPVEREVDLHRAAAALPPLDVGRRSRRAARRGRVLEERDLRVGRRDRRRRRAISSPDCEHDAASRGRCARRCGARSRRCARSAPNDSAALAQRLGDRAHAARGEAPRRRAGRRRRRRSCGAPSRSAVPGERGPAQVPMTPLTDEHAVHLRRLEVLVEQVGDARREQAGDVADGAHVETAHLPRELGLLEQVAGRLRAELRRNRR